LGGHAARDLLTLREIPYPGFRKSGCNFADIGRSDLPRRVRITSAQQGFEIAKVGAQSLGCNNELVVRHLSALKSTVVLSTLFAWSCESSCFLSAAVVQP